MDEDFLDVKENSKKTAILYVFIVIAIVVAGYFLVFKKVYFSLKTVHLELGESLSTDISEYVNQKIENEKEWKLDISKVKVNEIGEYTYSVTYNNVTKNGKIKVEDKTAPLFTLQEMTIEEDDDDYFLGDFLATCEDYSKPCLVSLKNNKDEDKFSIIGTHSIDIVIADVYGNKSSAKATLKVVEKGTYVDPKSLDLEYASNSKGQEDFNGKVYMSLEKALNVDDREVEAKMLEISTVDFHEYVRENFDGYNLVSSEVIQLYNKSGYVIGFSVELKIKGNGEKTIYVDKSKVPVMEDDSNDEETKEND